MLATERIVLMGLAVLAFSSCGGNDRSATSGSPTRAAGNDASPAARGREVQEGRVVFRRYLSSDQTSGALFISAMDDSGEHQLSSPGESVLDGQPDWSPDGTRVLFTRVKGLETPGESHQVLTVSSDGKGVKALTPDCPELKCGSSTDGAFSSDGRFIAFSHAMAGTGRHPGIFVMDADGRNRRRVTRAGSYDLGGVQWSPDGRRLVFARSNAEGEQPALGRALFIINADGTGQRRLTPWSLGANGTPDWSPRDDLIVFRAVADEEVGEGNFFTIHPDGTGLTQVTHFTGSVISHKVGFSPDGGWIVFGKIGGSGNGDLFIAKSDGSNMQPVTQTPMEEGAPDWAPIP